MKGFLLLFIEVAPVRCVRRDPAGTANWNKSGNQRIFAGFRSPMTDRLVKPKGSNRPSCPSEVPRKFGDDYSEARLVIADSPKSAAALGRGRLQNLLREVVA